MQGGRRSTGQARRRQRDRLRRHHRNRALSRQRRTIRRAPAGRRAELHAVCGGLVNLTRQRRGRGGLKFLGTPASSTKRKSAAIPSPASVAERRLGRQRGRFLLLQEVRADGGGRPANSRGLQGRPLWSPLCGPCSRSLSRSRRCEAGRPQGSPQGRPTAWVLRGAPQAFFGHSTPWWTCTLPMPL